MPGNRHDGTCCDILIRDMVSPTQLSIPAIRREAHPSPRPTSSYPCVLVYVPTAVTLAPDRISSMMASTHQPQGCFFSFQLLMADMYRFPTGLRFVNSSLLVRLSPVSVLRLRAFDAHSKTPLPLPRGAMAAESRHERESTYVASSAVLKRFSGDHFKTEAKARLCFFEQHGK